jgi:hypothetical protein
MYIGHPVSKDRLVIKKNKWIKLKTNLFYIITADIKSFFYVIPMKVQSLVISCNKFLYGCIVQICRQSTEPVFNCLLYVFIATHACAT